MRKGFYSTGFIKPLNCCSQLLIKTVGAFTLMSNPKRCLNVNVIGLVQTCVLLCILKYLRRKRRVMEQLFCFELKIDLLSFYHVFQRTASYEKVCFTLLNKGLLLTCVLLPEYNRRIRLVRKYY